MSMERRSATACRCRLYGDQPLFVRRPDRRTNGQAAAKSPPSEEQSAALRLLVQHENARLAAGNLTRCGNVCVVLAASFPLMALISDRVPSYFVIAAWVTGSLVLGLMFFLLSWHWLQRRARDDRTVVRAPLGGAGL